MSNTPYILAIHRGLRLTYPRFQKLKSHFQNDWEKAFKSDLKHWIEAGIDKKGLEKWFVNKHTIDPAKELQKLQNCGAQLLCCDDPEFPLALQHIANPPAILLVRGPLKENDWPSVSVVGSRKISQYGKRAIAKILTPICQANITIVSGLAYGTDTLAHQIALQNNTRTIAVLGNGIDYIYPTANESLAKKIMTNGAIVSEFLPGTKARPEYFPVRNRIVAGLSQGTVIVEAAQKSGSLITADYAIEFGREVFALPGEIFNPNAAGTNQLLRDGAHCALSGEQILSTLGIKATNKSTKIDLPTTGIESEIIKSLTVQKSYHIDEIIRLCGFPNTTVNSHLMLMEMKGWIKNLGGQMYVRNI